MRGALASLLVKIGLFMIKMAVKLKPKSEVEKLSAVIRKATKTISDVFDDKNNVYEEYIEKRIEEVKEKSVCCGKCEKDKESVAVAEKSETKTESVEMSKAKSKTPTKKEKASKTKPKKTATRKTKKTTRKTKSAKAKKE